MNNPANRTPASSCIDRLADTLLLDAPVTALKGIQSARAALLKKLHIHTVKDLLYHFPRRYLDLSQVCTIANAPVGTSCTIYARIHSVTLKHPKPKLPIVEVTLTDHTGTMIASFFHMPWLANKLKPGMILAVAGKVIFDYGFKRMTNPYFEEVDEISSQGKVLAIHPATEKLSTAVIRRLVMTALQQTRGLYDPLPAWIRQKRNLISKGAALAAIHIPQTYSELAEAKKRLVYEEVFLLQIFLMQQGNGRKQGKQPFSHKIEGDAIATLSAALPFELTQDQKNAIQDVFTVLHKAAIADHMIFGDVGTGKTIVAAFAIAAAKESAGQVLFMAPTEILATQQYEFLSKLFASAHISCALITGSTKPADRKCILEQFKQGSLDVLVGTQALLEPDVIPSNLSLCVIDEQQRFGVHQRSALIEKGNAPDALYLTATPIPRSLALTLFGNVTHSVIRQKPHAEAQRNTVVYRKQERGKAYDAAKEVLAKGEQVYVVCPLVGTVESNDNHSFGGVQEGEDTYYPDVLIEDEQDFDAQCTSSAIQEAKLLQKRVFLDNQVGLLHGGMSAEEKKKALSDFKEGKTQVLVCTTVIEVGVDVEQATVMIIEDADRFGLAQLHQLRGRVGRGNHDSQVFLISSSKQPLALKRLEVLADTDDGFTIASHDLSLRREGDILGNKQSGATSLKLVNIVSDSELIEQAHKDACLLLEKDPNVALPEHAALARDVRLTFAQERQVGGG